MGIQRPGWEELMMTFLDAQKIEPSLNGSWEAGTRGQAEKTAGRKGRHLAS